ncbi:unnamed protein product [Caenorhabditis auriculariae]|uniref:Uncharacterized protein n=1 Tax=Caenorhabditis auriculariae TaxID=2777116 RepID=A0A8S1GPP6_9PELO|nr:unnamed protein product [Caenorhabditis auriculariae]
MAPWARLLVIFSLCAVLLTSLSSAQSEPAKDKKQGRKVSEVGPSFMKRTPLFFRPQRHTLALLLLS